MKARITVIVLGLAVCVAGTYVVRAYVRWGQREVWYSRCRDIYECIRLYHAVKAQMPQLDGDGSASRSWRRSLIDFGAQQQTNRDLWRQLEVDLLDQSGKCEVFAVTDPQHNWIGGDKEFSDVETPLFVLITQPTLLIDDDVDAREATSDEIANNRIKKYPALAIMHRNCYMWSIYNTDTPMREIRPKWFILSPGNKKKP